MDSCVIVFRFYASNLLSMTNKTRIINDSKQKQMENST